MDLDRFWSIIDASREAGGDDQDAQCEELGRLLGELPAEEVGSFQIHFDDATARA